MADNVIEENVISKIQVKQKEYYFGIKYDSQRNIIDETYFRRDEMPQIEEVVTNAQTAITGAENVDATITDANVLEVTGRDGVKKRLELASQADAATIKKDLAAEQKITKVLQKSEEDGYYIVDEDGNIVAQYNSKGFDVALLSEHIKNLIKNINDVGFPDDIRLMLLNTIISSISENSWNLIDNNYNIAAKYDISGFDVAKINKHFKRLIDSVGFAEIAKLYSSDNPYGVNYTKYYISGRERFIDKNNIIPLFIVAGQSNAVGAETQDHSPEWLVRGKLENYNMWNPQQHAFSTYNIVGNNGGENGGTSGNFGFDIYFAKKWLDTYGTPIYACKVATGGTAIGYKQGAGYCWNADIAMLKENNCISLCEVFINRIKDIFEWGIQNNKIIVPIAILWLQGETDAVQGFQNDYQTNLSAVFSLLRGCLGSNTIPIINAPIERKSESARATINAAYTAMNNLDKNFFTVNTDDFVEGTHYNYRIWDYHFLAEGYKEIGERMFTIYKNNFNL